MAVPVLETAQDGGAVIAYRIGDGEWIDAGQVRVAMPMPMPAGVKPGERWIDVDLDQQLLVAYEGDLPVYATLVSTGLKDTPTETGIYRIWKKVSETDMKGLTGEDPYSVATVPWTQFFSPEKGLALHTSYWHDRFGFQKSHGCVNLAPRDARWLYFFTDPQVPPGWSMAAGVVEAPGSVVRVRSKADPDPPVRGYAQKVDDADR
ncbi:MAG: L,D-transpeptidase [Myxococcales bacterium]|nr:L,D-transpeptidase [Myxococcales bacterium]MBP6846808.1 L,D-transpeptidase [Kofleriaceae bacterium]